MLHFRFQRAVCAVAVASGFLFAAPAIASASEDPTADAITAIVRQLATVQLAHHDDNDGNWSHDDHRGEDRRGDGRWRDDNRRHDDYARRDADRRHEHDESRAREWREHHRDENRRDDHHDDGRDRDGNVEWRDGGNR